MTTWTDFVKDFAKKANISYGCALSMPDVSQQYRFKYKKGEFDEKPKRIKVSREESIGELYSAVPEEIAGVSPMKRLPEKKGKGIIEDLAKRERGQITTETLLAERDRARIAELEARLERMNAMVGNSPRPTAKGGRKTYDGRK